MKDIIGIQSFDGALQASIFKSGIFKNITLKGIGCQPDIDFCQSVIVLDTGTIDLPYYDYSQRFSVSFNGEIYNARECEHWLVQRGYYVTSPDIREVVLGLFIESGIDGFEQLNGQFVIALYDKLEKKMILVRDKYGIKPVYYYCNGNVLIFASRIRHIMSFDIPKYLNYSAVYGYFKHNYTPGLSTVLSNIYKLAPGHALIASSMGLKIQRWYSLPPVSTCTMSLDKSCDKLEALIDNAVEIRMKTNGQIGCYLSGGIDSTVIAATAKKFCSNLITFNLGLPEQPFFDETHWALLASKHLKTEHHTVNINVNTIEEALPEILDNFDEPYADSSSILLYILAHATKKSITTVLTGDGADELFGGYRKHLAHFRAANMQKGRLLLSLMLPFLNLMPKSRKSRFNDTIRQLTKFAQGIKLKPSERYAAWASIASEKDIDRLLKNITGKSDYNDYIGQLTAHLNIDENIGEISKADIQLVLHGDMLPKIDFAHRIHDLTARSPFLDSSVVEYALSLPEQYKVDHNSRKKILQQTYRKYLPAELFSRPKKGFEMPLQQFLRGIFFNKIENEYLNKEYIIEQGLFNVNETERIKNQLYSSNVGDIPARLWALVVFQHWYKKHYDI